jgi:peptidoglycan/xylan/chitin deacetylase (PgdA/CDA1 family)
MQLRPIFTRLMTVMLLFCSQALTLQHANAQYWNNHACAVALTFDDGLNVHLDKAIPLMDSLGFKGTFYIPGNAQTLGKRITDWRSAAARGHELGNHTLFHPCAGSPAGREWVNPNYDLDHYSLKRITDEIQLANTLLSAIDDKQKRTFAYTCGEMHAGNVSFYELVKSEFAAARGVAPGFETAGEANTYNLKAFMISGQTGEEMISLVKQAMESKTLLVFLFHGVGGEHSIDVDWHEFRKLLLFLKAHEQAIWVAPLVDIAPFLNPDR